MYRGWYGNSLYLTRVVCKLMPALVDYMNVVNICTYLLAEELLTFDERSEILQLQGKHRQVPYLFEILSTKGKDWYCRFWRALKNSVSWNADIHLGHKDLLEMLPNASDEKPLWSWKKMDSTNFSPLTMKWKNRLLKITKTKLKNPSPSLNANVKSYKRNWVKLEDAMMIYLLKTNY